MDFCNFKVYLTYPWACSLILEDYSTGFFTVSSSYKGEITKPDSRGWEKNLIINDDSITNIVKAGLWGLINNAGVTGQPGHYTWWTRDEIRSIIEVNLLGVVEVTNVFLPLIKKAKGRVVNISSALGIISAATGGYEMAKYGVEAFSDGLR